MAFTACINSASCDLNVHTCVCVCLCAGTVWRKILATENFWQIALLLEIGKLYSGIQPAGKMTEY